MNVLHVDSSILGPNSVSRQLSADIVAQLRSAHLELDVTYRDLALDPIAHLSGALLAAASAGPVDHPAPLRDDLAASDAALREFLAADIIVIGAALYNFGIPSQLKAWVDRILVAGQTFRYGADGRPEGLVGDKRVIVAVARGGFYGPGSPTQAFEHAETYLRTVLGFIGIHAPEIIVAEGIAVSPDQRAAAIAQAEATIAALAV